MIILQPAITWHDDVTSLHGTLAATRLAQGHVLVSARLPLLADLTVAENIALPREYHLGVHAALARLQAREFVSRLLSPERADLYPENLTTAETFAALWLRAVAVPGRTIVLDTPMASFNLDEAALRGYVTRSFGLYRHAHAHELHRRPQCATAEAS